MSRPRTNSHVSTPLLESFQIEGLNGYKNIKLNLERNVKIISAENGSGKTTVLNALYALLTGKLDALLAVNFSRFSIKFVDMPPISASRNELIPDLSWPSKYSTYQQASLRAGLTAGELNEMVLLAAGGQEIFDGCAGAKLIGKMFSIDKNVLKMGLRDVFRHSLSLSNRFNDIRAQIKTAMGDVSVLYLPTFRRIEADLTELQDESTVLPQTSLDYWDADRLIFFGLQDVERRLDTVTRDIKKETFEAYARINAGTLDQLLGANMPTTTMDADSVDLSALRLVLARMGKTDGSAEDRIVKLIQSGEINKPEHGSLRAFLLQLLEVHQGKRLEEEAIEAFVGVVDSYWGQSSEKSFRYDKLTIEATAINTHTGQTLRLGSLSSGEKQIVSIFARLYLNAGKRYLILIDEPELSLSMEWQQKFLPDVLAAPSCAQLIAITHSPFIFDNELDPYAGSLEISYQSKPAKVSE